MASNNEKSLTEDEKLKKIIQPTLANILGRKLLVSGTRSGTFLDSQPKKFPRIHSEIVVPGGLVKDQP